MRPDLIQSSVSGSVIFPNIKNDVNGCSIKGDFENDDRGVPYFVNRIVIGHDDLLGANGLIETYGQHFITECNLKANFTFIPVPDPIGEFDDEYEVMGLTKLSQIM